MRHFLTPNARHSTKPYRTDLGRASLDQPISTMEIPVAFLPGRLSHATYRQRCCICCETHNVVLTKDVLNFNFSFHRCKTTTEVALEKLYTCADFINHQKLNAPNAKASLSKMRWSSSLWVLFVVLCVSLLGLQLSGRYLSLTCNFHLLCMQPDLALSRKIPLAVLWSHLRIDF